MHLALTRSISEEVLQQCRYIERPSTQRAALRNFAAHARDDEMLFKE